MRTGNFVISPVKHHAFTASAFLIYGSKDNLTRNRTSVAIIVIVAEAV